MSNAILDPKVYANVGLALLKNNLVMAKLVSGEYKKEFEKTGAKKGNKTWAKRPPEFVIRRGAVAQVQDVVEGEVPITLSQQSGVDFQFTSVEETLSVDALLKSKTMKSAMTTIAEEIDARIHLETKKFYNWVGTPGEIVNSYADLSKAPQRLDEMAVESSNRKGVMPPSDGWGMINSIANLQTEKEASDALTKAKLPIIGNIDWYATQNAATVTTGTRSGNALVDGADQDVTYAEVKDGLWTQSLNLKTVGNSTTVGDGEVFTIDGVYAINPRSKTAMSYLQQFTVVARDALGDSTVATADSSGDLTITISPPMITSGAFQNVSAAPADEAAITWMGNATEGDTDATAYQFSSAFMKESIALVSAKLIKPYSGESSFAVDKDTGLAIRYWRTSDGTNDTHLHRFDVLYDVLNVDPRRGTRLSGTA